MRRNRGEVGKEGKEGRGIIGDGPLFASNVFIDWKRLFLGRQITLKPSPNYSLKRFDPWMTINRLFDISSINEENEEQDRRENRRICSRKRSAFYESLAKPAENLE